MLTCNNIIFVNHLDFSIIEMPAFQRNVSFSIFFIVCLNILFKNIPCYISCYYYFYHYVGLLKLCTTFATSCCFVYTCANNS